MCRRVAWNFTRPSISQMQPPSFSNLLITWASSFSYHRPRDCKNVSYKSLIPCFWEPTNQQNVSPHSAINLSDATPQLLEPLDHLSFEFLIWPAFFHLLPTATLIIFRAMGTREISRVPCITINLSCSNLSITWASSFSYHRPSFTYSNRGVYNPASNVSTCRLKCHAYRVTTKTLSRFFWAAQIKSSNWFFILSSHRAVPDTTLPCILSARERIVVRISTRSYSKLSSVSLSPWVFAHFVDLIVIL